MAIWSLTAAVGPCLLAAFVERPKPRWSQEVTR